MPDRPVTRPVPPSRLTRAALATGTAVAVACFAVALVLDALGRSGGGGTETDVAAVLGSVARLEAWGWATLGTFAVIVTPAAALVATAIEYRGARDGRTSLAAAGVLAILGISLVLSLVGR